jgi:hypothetical protein
MVELSLCFNRAPRHKGVLGEWRYSSTHSLTSALDGGERSASRPGNFSPRERAPSTHWIGGWPGPRAVLDTVVSSSGTWSLKFKRKNENEVTWRNLVEAWQYVYYVLFALTFYKLYK